MNISGEQIKAALTKYDNLGSYLGNWILSEKPEITQLRHLASQLTTKELNLKEISSLVQILDSVTINKDSTVRFKELFQSLEKLFGDKLEALKRLEKNHVLEQYAERIEAHENPLSAARMVTHFLKYQKKQSGFLSFKEIDLLFENADPYRQLKTSTSTARALDCLQRAAINHSEATKSTIEKRPVLLAKALKKFDLHCVKLTSAMYGLIIHSDRPVEMAQALISLEQQQKPIQFKQEIIKWAQSINNPDFILACIYLNKKEIYNFETVERIKQSLSPLHCAELIHYEKMRALVNESSVVAYGLLRFGVFVSTGRTDRPEVLFDRKQEQIRSDMNARC